ncbi:Ceramidase [Trinorchestia longiramus]|nr:Ceramidase [Trinorchestia longiramus]
MDEDKFRRLVRRTPNAKCSNTRRFSSCSTATVMIIRKEALQQWVEAGSSPVDWCEENYTVSNNIAEFTNTLSNMPFFVIPVLCIISGAWKSYAQYASIGAYVQFACIFLVGASSAYFHASLSFLGQMLDELGILWLLCLSYSFFTPNRYRPKFFQGAHCHIIAVGVATILTFAGFAAPQLNAYALFILAAPIIIMKVCELTLYKDPVTSRMTKIALACCCLGIGVWVADRVMCSLWITLKIPGLHNIWHILIAVSFYLDLCLFAYWRSYSDIPSCIPTMRYWPSKRVGLPYVHCKRYDT